MDGLSVRLVVLESTGPIAALDILPPATKHTGTRINKYDLDRHSIAIPFHKGHKWQPVLISYPPVSSPSCPILLCN